MVPAPTRTARHPADKIALPLQDAARRFAGGRSAEIESWLSTLDPAARDEALSIMAAENGKNDPQRAEYDARRIKEPGLRREAVALALAYRFETDREGALAILRDESDAELRASIAARLLPALADLDAPAAARFIESAGGTLGDPAALLSATTQRWARQDPAAAADWLAALSDESLRREATAALVGEWGRRDAPALEKWLDQHPTATEFQSAYADWRDPWSPAQWEAWFNQTAAVEEGSVGESYDKQGTGSTGEE